METRKNENIKVTDEELIEFFPDLPKGTLDKYREQATFDWRRMKLVYDTLSAIKLKNDMWKFMEDHPLFKRSSKSLTLDETRRIATQRMYALHNEKFINNQKIFIEPSTFQAELEAMFMFDTSLAIKLSLTFKMCAKAIATLGGEYHNNVLKDLEKGKIGGCFAMTEITHGSNAKGMRTTATYCPDTKEFEIHTPDFEAAKCWVGPLGKCATHAVLYALLISKGENHGMHSFVVPVRDPNTLLPYPGVIVGDLGEKLGLHGVDNGFLMFNHYRIPKEAALAKFGGVDDNGEYKTPFKDPSKRYGASLGPLSGGRVHITSVSTNYLQKAIVIAIRYSAVRIQFGPEGSDEELPVLEYQLQQVRLLPYLAATYAQRILCNWFQVALLTMGMRDRQDERGIEIHALASALKPICGWTTRDGIQNCREACGGHGYLKAAGIGDLRNDNDANCTYEGENSLLLQQASNWLLNVWSKRVSDSPYGSVAFMENADQLLTEKCPWNTVEEFIVPENIIRMYNWLTVYVLKTTFEKVKKLKEEGKDNFSAKNESQSYNAVTLSVTYGENFMLTHFYKTVMKFDDESCRTVLLKLVSLYGAFMLEKHLASFYIGQYFTKEEGLSLREGILQLCSSLSSQAVALVDTLAPPDFCLNSVLGYSDGQVYKHLQTNLMTSPDAMTRPEWWREVVYWQNYVINSKI